jgi:hypothetical protein
LAVRQIPLKSLLGRSIPEIVASAIVPHGAALFAIAAIAEEARF